MQLKDFSQGYRTNNITTNCIQAGYNMTLKDTPYGKGLYRSNGNTLSFSTENADVFCLNNNGTIYELADQDGNTLISQNNYRVGERIIGGFDYQKGDIHYGLVFTNTGSESKAYLFFNETLTLIKSGMSSDAKHFNAENFNNGVFVTNGIDAPFFYKYGATPAITNINATAYDGTLIRGLALKRFDNRLFMGSGSGLYSCGLGDPTDWNSADVETTRAGYIKNFMNSSATITAIEEYRGSLIIHRTSDTVWLSGTSGNYSMEVISNAGCASPFALANLDIYQMYFLNHINGVGIYNLSKNALGKIEDESEISRFIHEEFLKIDNTRNDEIYCLTNTKKSELWVHIPRTDYPNNAYWIIYNLTSKCFYPPRITQKITAAWLFNGEIRVGTESGDVLREDYGDTFNSEAISFRADTYSMDFGTLLKKEFDEQLRYTLDGKIQNKFTISYIRNDDESLITSRDIEVVPSGCLIWAPSSDVTDEKYMWGKNFCGSVPSIARCGKPSSFYTLKIRLSGTGDVGLLCLDLPDAELA